VRFHSFRSFRGRLVAVFVGLFAVILATCFLVVAAAVRASARHEIGEELRLAGTLFVRQPESRSQQLVAATRPLSGDFALKTAAATADQETTRSVLANHRQRIEADVLMLVSPEGSIAADTRQPGRLGAAFPLSRLLEEADQAGEASRIVVIDGGLYRLAIVPLLAPVPIAWLCAGFAIDDRSAADLRRLTGLHVSFLRRQDSGFTVHASTLDGADRDELQRGLAAARTAGVIKLGGHRAPVSFPNRDNVRHHVYPFSSPKKFELPLYIGTPAAPVLFDKPGVVALGCNIHDWMLAYIYVVTTPYFAKTAADGKARLDGLTPGTYEARVWQPRMRGDIEKTAKPVTLAAGEPGQVAFVVSLKAEWRAPRAPDSYTRFLQGSTGKLAFRKWWLKKRPFDQ